MQFIDAGISHAFLKSHLSKLSTSGQKIFIINTYDPSFDFSPFTSQNPDTTFLTRLTLPYTTKLTKIKQYSKFNIIAILVSDYSQLKAVIGLQPDLICFTPNVNLKAGFVRDAMFKNIFFELGEDLRVCKYLIEITKGRNCVYGSMANNVMHIKGYRDVCLYLKAFGYKHDPRVVVNRFLKCCWEKRYTFRGVLTNDVVKDEFKKLFLPV